MSETATYDIPDDATEGMRALMQAVREGRAEDVPGLVGPLTGAERRRCLPVLKVWRETTWATWEAGPRAVRAALLPAGAGCSTGAAAAAQWLGGGVLGWPEGDTALVLQALGDRDPEWLGQVAHRMAARRSVAEREYPVIARLVRAAGCEPPTTDGFVLGWERDVRDRARLPYEDLLRDDPFLDAMLPRFFEVPEAGWSLQHGTGWAEALTALTAEGRLSRDMLIDGCVSRLLRGARLGILQGFLGLLTALDPTEQERADRLLTWVRILPDAHPLVVGRAQEMLAGLDAAGRLGTELLAEASRAALFRPEKKIVRAQLAMLDKAMKRDPSCADALLPAAAEAFAHEEHILQEQALTLVVRHRRHAGAAVLAELAAGADRLAPDLRRRAAEAFGGAVVAEPSDAPAAGGDSLPPAPTAARLEPAPSTPAEAAEEAVALLSTSGATPAQCERAVNGLVVHAHADPAGLRAALEPILALLPRTGVLSWSWLHCVVMSVMGRVSEEDLRVIGQRPSHHCLYSAASSAARIRAAEIGARLGDGPLPFLLATPTWSTGTLDPAELVARLAAYERLGAEAGPADLDQALLRLDREVPPEALAAAAGLTSPAGRRLAAWLAAGGLPDPASSHEAGWERLDEPDDGVLIRTEAVPGREDLPEPFRSLLGAFDPRGRRCWCGTGQEDSLEPLALLPQHREVVAARLLVPFAVWAGHDAHGRVAPVLPALAESGGPAGPATHLLVAYGLGARRTEEQLFAVDALLVLAARGALDPDRLGRDIAELTGLQRLKPTRWVTALREAVRTGAYATVWAVLAAALPGLLTGEVPHGLSAVLTLAAECAEASQAPAPIPGIAELASRPPTSQLVTQARRIRTATLPPAGAR